MSVDDVVFQDYQGIRRFGVIRKKFFLDDWAHYEVEWVDDQRYNHAMEKKIFDVIHIDATNCAESTLGKK